MVNQLKNMKILVTNDDGIHAPGLAILENAARALSKDVVTVAPAVNQSGTAHSLTLHSPLRLHDHGENRYAVDGTPTDCVLMAIRHLLKDDLPDLILSGVNYGQNMAEDVTYSGTVAAAMEGTTLGIPSLAFSQVFGHHSKTPNFDVAARYLPELITNLVQNGFPKHVLLNVNFPDPENGLAKGIKVTTQGQRDQKHADLIERFDARKQPYYWIGFQRREEIPKQNSDLTAVRSGYISVTPLHLDLTEHEQLPRLQANINQDFDCS